MRKVIYQSPIRETARVGSPGALRPVLDKLFTEDDRFWMCGSGDVLFKFAGADREASLALMCRRPFGYHIIYALKRGEGDRDMYVSAEGSEFRELVSLFVGGDFFNFWRDFFVTEEKARLAVKQFC